MAGKGLRLGIGWRLGIIVVAAVERLGIGGAVPAGPHPNLRMHPYNPALVDWVCGGGRG